ncbi:UvrD-helicase domain-containing protein [Streptomyces chilikensis]|uniref:DNA 3'-5' helicase n=1 Tax=Streptomyces chilikensis TaxID=1194079 RepID=A0ABV3EUD8_9ACTN
MTDVFTGTPPLTPEQQAVVDQPWDARLLVTAGAGAGKTHTLVRRLDALVGHEEDALEAGEILVLTFSRAAARELRDRIARYGDRAGRVRAQTFDSWAYSLLTNAYPDEEWGRHSFDERIRQAESAITKGAVEAVHPVAPAHIVVDEVQDLVGDRRLMVETLLDHFQESCGFTMVGDPAQAIYGFQVKDPQERALETNAFFDWLRASYPDDLVELHLTENFRASTDEARTALPVGRSLQALPSAPDEATTAAEEIHDRLRVALMDQPSFGGFTDRFVLDSLRDFPDSCAILCRDNRQALLISETLWENGVPHRLRRSAQDRPVPSWAAALLRRTSSETLTQERFRELMAEVPLSPDTEVERCWRSLRGVARARNGLLDLARVRRSIAEGWFPDDLAPKEPSPLVVSTVHRAKGLEFDRVLVVEPSPVAQLRKQFDDVDVPAEARALYVAMTRPRYDLYRITAPESWRMRYHRALDRWYVGGRQRWERLGLEAKGQDVCSEHPPGTDGFEDSPAALQDHLAASVRPGDPVVLRKLHDLPVDEGQSPPYVVLHEGRPVAMTSERFRRDLHTSLKVSRSWEVRWPNEIHGLRIDTLETVAGSRASGNRAGLGEHGVWLVPRLSGLGRYKSGEDAGEGDNR